MMGTIQKKQIFRNYRNNETFRYKLIVEGSANVQSTESRFKILSVYELVYIRYEETDKLYHFSLKELSYKIDASEDDPIIAQIIEMSNNVSAIYQHLEFGVNGNGNIKKIYNRDEIDDKWEKTKEYLTYKHPLSSLDIIKTKEREFEQPEREILNISFMHFLQVYFKQFGHFDDQEEFEEFHHDQFGTGIPLKILIKFENCKPLEEGKIHRRMKGRLVRDTMIKRELLRSTRQPLTGSVSYEIRADYYSEGMIIEKANFSYKQKIGEEYTLYNYLELEQIKEGNDG